MKNVENESLQITVRIDRDLLTRIDKVVPKLKIGRIPHRTDVIRAGILKMVEELEEEDGA